MIRSLLVVSLVLLGGFSARAQSVISNVKSWQEPGTHRVKITYDVAPGNTCTTALQASLDGGANYDLVIPPAAITADSQLGPGMAGSGRTVKIDAAEVSELIGGSSKKGIFTKNLRFKVVASSIVTHGQMVYIPGGPFQMGDAIDGNNWSEWVHSVDLSGFYLQNTEVTWAQWYLVRAWGLKNGYTDLENAGANGIYHPASGQLSWHTAIKWCNARSEMEDIIPCYTVDGGQVYKTGNRDDVACNWSASGYRLPSEAEWEKAARGGLSGKRFPWGDTISHSQSNYCVYSSDGITNLFSYDITPRPGYSINYYYHPDYSVGTSHVGSFSANGYGLYDMAGNVNELCWDWWSDQYYQLSPGSDPHGPDAGTLRIYRGGSFFDSHGARHCRVANRHFNVTNGSDGHTGFRPARSAVP